MVDLNFIAKHIGVIGDPAGYSALTGIIGPGGEQYILAGYEDMRSGGLFLVEGKRGKRFRCIGEWGHPRVGSGVRFLKPQSAMAFAHNLSPAPRERMVVTGV